MGVIPAYRTDRKSFRSKRCEAVPVSAAAAKMAAFCHPSARPTRGDGCRGTGCETRLAGAVDATASRGFGK